MNFRCQDIVVGGDSQCDFPGFNAKNLCYFMVEENSSCIIDIEILDKRHVGLISTNMEKEAIKRSLTRLQDDVKVVEVVIDASTSVKAFVGKSIIIIRNSPHLVRGLSFITNLEWLVNLKLDFKFFCKCSLHSFIQSPSRSTETTISIFSLLKS
jgi:hypothetical protein